MFKFWRSRKAEPLAITEPPRAAVDPLDDIPRYPPFAKGLPAANPEQLLATQQDLIKDIQQTLRFTPDEFQDVVVPVIKCYAAYIHLLPASENHHHRGAGGLFRHGLEVGFWAARASLAVEFCLGETQINKRMYEPIWQFAVFLGGLLHDSGKPLSDVAVTTFDGSRMWNPYAASLSDWLAEESVDRYFLRWRDGRNKRHEKFALMIVDKIITDRAKQVLNKPGPKVMQSLLEAICGTSAEDTVSKLVLKADQESVTRDLTNSRLYVDENQVGVPVERFIFDGLRQLVMTVKINQPGAAIWRLESGLYIAWPLVVRELQKYFDSNAIPGVPRNPETLADILIEKGYASPAHAKSSNADFKMLRYWTVAPECIAPTRLTSCLYLPDLYLVFSNEPPSPAKARVYQTVEEANAAAETDESNIPESPNTDAMQEQAVGEPVLQVVRRTVEKTTSGATAPATIPTTQSIVDDDVRSKPNKKEKSEQTPQSKMQKEAMAAPKPESAKSAGGARLPELLRGDSDGIAIAKLAIQRYLRDPAFLTLIPERGLGLAYPTAVSALGEAKTVLNCLATAGLLQLDPLENSKAITHNGKKYALLHRQITDYACALLESGQSLPIVAPAHDAVFYEPAPLPTQQNTQETPDQTNPVQKPLPAKPHPRPEDSAPKPKGKPEFNQDEFRKEFISQIRKGSGSFIDGEVTSEVNKRRITYTIHNKSIQKIAGYYQINPTIVSVGLTKIPGVTVRGSDEFITIELAAKGPL